MAAISVGALAGENGLFSKAKEAGNKTNIAQEKEKNTLNEYAEEIDKYLEGGTVKLINVDTSKTDPLGAMPDGATIIENDGDKGIVIKDKNNNEWTWVEVPKSIYTNTTYNGGTEPEDSEDYAKIASVMANYASAYVKSGWTDTWYSGCGISNAETYTAMYNKMLKSTYENGGFWIARYEAGIEGSNEASVTTGRTESSKGNISTKSVSQLDMIPYNYVTCSEAQTLASSMSLDNNKTSSLLFGIQWDLVCKYLEENATILGDDENTRKGVIKTDSTNWGNYYNSGLELMRGKYNIDPSSTTSAWKAYNVATENYVTIIEEGEEKNIQTANNQIILLTTGASNKTSILNIADFAGNAWEWTLEKTSNTDNPSGGRGGGCNNDGGKAFNRSHFNTSASKYNVSFRVSVY